VKDRGAKVLDVWKEGGGLAELMVAEVTAFLVLGHYPACTRCGRTSKPRVDRFLHPNTQNVNVSPTPTLRRTLTPLLHGYRTIHDYLTNTAGLFSTRNVLLCAGTCKLSRTYVIRLCLTSRSERESGRYL